MHFIGSIILDYRVLSLDLSSSAKTILSPDLVIPALTCIHLTPPAPFLRPPLCIDHQLATLEIHGFAAVVPRHGGFRAGF